VKVRKLIIGWIRSLRLESLQKEWGDNER